MTMDDLLARVDGLYRASNPPAWSNPHADRDASPEEYSRVTDPDRWGIVQLRTLAWLHAVAELLDAEVEPSLPPIAMPAPVGWLEVRSPRPGTLPVHVHFDRDVLPQARLAFAEPENLIWDAPGGSCACDACDHGSDDELEVVDRFFDRVLTGSLVSLRGEEYAADLDLRDGCGGAGGGAHQPMDFDEAMAAMRALGEGRPVDLPDGVRGFHGAPWVG